MNKPKSLNTRVVEAKLLASLSTITSKDNHGRARTIEVPGSDGARYRVIIRRGFNTIETECSKSMGHSGHAHCQGNMSGVCRHSIAATIKSMEEAGYIARFRKDRGQAAKLAYRMANVALTTDGGPVVLTVKSHNGKHAELYFIALELDALTLSNNKKAN